MQRKISCHVIVLVLLITLLCKTGGGGQSLCVPLFDEVLENNKLPQGNYMLLRSHEKVTQVLVVRGRSMVLYVDEDNTRDGVIAARAYSPGMTGVSQKSMSQGAFTRVVEELIVHGQKDEGGGPGYKGILAYVRLAARNRTHFSHKGYFYTVREMGGTKPRLVSVMKMDCIFHSLHIKNILGGNRGIVFPIFIKDSRDSNIKALIKRYGLEFYRISLGAGD